MTQNNTDWNAVWMERQKMNANSGQGGGCPHAWMSEEAARQYYRRSSKGYAANERLQCLQSIIEDGWRVLDIGAGPGNLAVPLAQKAGHITVVEPADGMVAVMKDNIEQAGIENIDVVHKKWDDVDIEADLEPPYRLTFASYSLGMLDLQAAIEKMMAVTSDTILLCWHAGDQPYDREAACLWPLLHRKPFHPIPKSDIVFNLLYQMGIYPHMEPMHSSNTVTFPSFEDALADYCRRYDVQNDTQRDQLIRYLESRLVPADEGVSLTSRHNGFKIWWHMNQEGGT